MRVVAVDPGETTGMAWATMPDLWREWPRFKIVGAVQRSFAAGESEGGTCQILGHDTMERTWKVIEQIAVIEPDVVVVEDFVLFVWKRLSMAREMLEPHAINANLRFIWWLAKLTAEEDKLPDLPFQIDGGTEPLLPKLVFQMPNEKDQMTDANLRKWKLWRTEKRQSGGPHAMDALRHLLVYLRREFKQ